jgi:hypothetical protein
MIGLNTGSMFITNSPVMRNLNLRIRHEVGGRSLTGRSILGC